MALLAMVKQELQPVREDLAAIRAELKDFASQTYSREMVDAMFSRVADEVKDIRIVQEEMKRDTIDYREKQLSRAALVLSTLYVLVNLLPHLGALLRP